MRSCVIFDMDGVLLDSEYGAFRHLQRYLNSIGIHMEMDELLTMVGQTSLDINRQIIDRFHLSMTPEEMSAAKNANGSYYETEENLVAMPGLESFLEMLKEWGTRMAVVSSTGSDGVLTALNRLNILRYMSVIVTSSMIRHPKPDPEGYLLAMKYLGAAPEDTIIIEDSPRGIEAAKKTGALTIGFKGSRIPQDTTHADHQARTYQECVRFLSPEYSRIFDGI